MRSAGNFNPEWGYLAPAPSFMRSVRIAVVAGAVGASAGAAVVFSLLDRPAAVESVAARTLAQPGPSVAAVGAPAVGQLPAQLGMRAARQNAAPPRPAVRSAAIAEINSPAAPESRAASAIGRAASAAALAEAPRMRDTGLASAHEETVSVPNETPPQGKASKKHRYVSWHYALRSERIHRAPLALLPSSGDRGGSFWSGDDY